MNLKSLKIIFTQTASKWQYCYLNIFSPYICDGNFPALHYAFL